MRSESSVPISFSFLHFAGFVWSILLSPPPSSRAVSLVWNWMGWGECVHLPLRFCSRKRTCFRTVEMHLSQRLSVVTTVPSTPHRPFVPAFPHVSNDSALGCLLHCMVWMLHRARLRFSVLPSGLSRTPFFFSFLFSSHSIALRLLFFRRGSRYFECVFDVLPSLLHSLYPLSHSLALTRSFVPGSPTLRFARSGSVTYQQYHIPSNSTACARMVAGKSCSSLLGPC